MFADAEFDGQFLRALDTVGDVQAEVTRLVDSILAKPRTAIAMGKALFYRQVEVGIDSAYADAGATMATNMMDPCALEGVQAFIEKRPPEWASARASRG